MTSVVHRHTVEERAFSADGKWVFGAAVLALLLGIGLVEETKTALAGVILLLAVIIPVLVIGVQVKATVLLLFGILFLAPGILVAPDLPRIMGDEFLIYITFVLVMAERLLASDSEPAAPMPTAGRALLLFIPLTLLTMANGAARFGINPTRGDYFEFFKFGKYVLALYLASSVRIDRRFLERLSWAVTLGAFVAAVTAILQSFDFPGVRRFFETLNYTAANDNAGEYLTNRAAGTIGNPNELALFVVAGMVFAVSLFYATKDPVRRLLLFTIAASQGLAILLSASRMGLLCGVVGVGLVIKRSAPRRVGVILLVTFVTSFVLLVMLAVADHGGNLPLSVHNALWPLLNRVERFSPNHFMDVFARFNMWEIAWSQTKKSLLLGYGPAKGALFLLTSSTADSEIFIVALRYGLVGIVIWIGIWVTFLRTGKRASNARDPFAALVGRALWSILVVNLLASTVNYTFLAVRRMTLVVLFVGLAAAIGRADRRNGRAFTGAHE